MEGFKRLIFTGLVIFSLGLSDSLSQATYSTYSVLGIGDITDSAVPAAMGMGGLGISNGSHWYLNNTNPALLHYNVVTLFSAGVLADTKTISQNGFDPNNAGNGNLTNVAMAFPIKSEKWSFSLVLMPYSTVNYNFNLNNPLSNTLDTAVISNRGSGGFDQLNLSFGGKVYKGLSAGIKLSYMLSSIRKQSASKILGVSIPTYVAAISSEQSVNDFKFGFGLAYEKNIGKNKLGLGLIYDFSANLSGQSFTTLEQQNLNGSPIFTDTLSDNSSVNFALPALFGVGVSYGRFQKWMVGFDIKTQDWGNYKTTENSNPENLGRNVKLILGAEYIPDIASVSSYFKRITFRLGGTFEQTPYVVNKQHINDLGINFGWSLPVSRFSSLDFGLNFGTRGTINNNLVRENYFKIYFGATFNDNRWFIRPKYN